MNYSHYLLQKRLTVFLFLPTCFRPMLFIYTSNASENLWVFLKFLGGMEKRHWPEIS